MNIHYTTAEAPLLANAHTPALEPLGRSSDLNSTQCTESNSSLVFFRKAKFLKQCALVSGRKQGSSSSYLRITWQACPNMLFPIALCPYCWEAWAGLTTGKTLYRAECPGNSGRMEVSVKNQTQGQKTVKDEGEKETEWKWGHGSLCCR